jgi:hypothetical protein
MTRHALAAALAALLATAGLADLALKGDANRGYILRERCWLPLEPDGVTLGLFRLDGEPSGEQALEATLDEVLKPAEDDAPAIATSTGGNVPDASLQRLAARTVGEVAWVRAGRTGGALQLTGQAGAALVTPSYPQLQGHGWQGSAEAWFRPAAASSDAVLLALPQRLGPALEVRRGAAGQLLLARGDQQLAAPPGARLPTDEWRHVCLQVWWAEVNVDGRTGIASPRAPGLRLLLNGALVAELKGADLAWLWPGSTGLCWLGNRPTGDAPFTGLLDEARISSRARDYYPLDATLPDPTAARPLPTAWPTMRDEADLLLQDPFDAAP